MAIFIALLCVVSTLPALYFGFPFMVLTLGLPFITGFIPVLLCVFGACWFISVAEEQQAR